MSEAEDGGRGRWTVRRRPHQRAQGPLVQEVYATHVVARTSRKNRPPRIKAGRAAGALHMHKELLCMWGSSTATPLFAFKLETLLDDE